MDSIGHIPDHAVYYKELLPVENPLFDETIPNVPRSQRRTEWTPIAMLGEAHVRVDETVAVDGYVCAGDVPGLGTAGDMGLRCMEIRSPYDKGRGYGIALCLVR
jgi:hypothetical protein